MEKALPVIPAKRYFTIGEVSELCGVKPYVLRYWEQEFTQLKPMKRRGNRRYYQHHEVLLIRRIRELLYEQGFTISGARNRLAEPAIGRRRDDAVRPEPDLSGAEAGFDDGEAVDDGDVDGDESDAAGPGNGQRAPESLPEMPPAGSGELSADLVRQELLLIRSLLSA